MNAVTTVARKELRGLFQSPIALLFLAVFELVVLFTFFSASRFFARNLADVRPLFAWLPVLLVFLTAAVTMRAWAEERKLGTLEVLMTLPVRTRDLVLGKFLAATALVAVGLLLTLPLPIMVSTLGDLDWGPVVGGYVGALLLGALYASIGLCVSARTDNQVVSLMVTLVIGGALYLVGTDVVTSLVGTEPAEVLRAIGTGSRFASIERGVLDLRDLVYYGALTAFFLVLNGAFLDAERADPGSERGRARTLTLWTVTALVAANAIAAVVWLTPVTAARVDLTANGDYSISATTTDILAQLDEPLFIDGYFSERTHPKLAPLVPQIKDLLAEYAIAGDGKVQVHFADPNQDEALEQELAEQYGIRSVPFQVDDRHQQSVVNSFFHILVRYGDKYEVLSFDDLIEVYADSDAFEVRLRNLEYDLTRTIKRVSQDFQTLQSVLADLPEPAHLTLYATPSSLPDDDASVLPLVEQVAKDTAAASGGKLQYEQVDPTGDDALQQRLFDQYGLRPLAADLFARQTYYFELVLTMGDKVERLAPRGDVKEADLKQAIEAAVKRVVPGQLTTLGVFTEIPEAPPPNPQLPPQFQPPPPRPDYQLLQQVLGDAYEVTPVQLDGDTPHVPDTVDVLLVAKPGRLSPRQQFAIDQYVMRGGKLIALAGSHDITVSREGLNTATAPASLRDLLAAYGVDVGGSFVLDAQMASFPRPKQERVGGGLVLNRVELEPYPFFIDVRGSGMDHDSPATSGLSSMTMPWASPLTVSAPEGVTATPLVHSTDEAWLYDGTSLDGGPPGSETDSYVLAATLTGSFPSYFADHPNPYMTGDASAEGADATGGTVKASLPDARVTVVGSSEFVSDLILSLASNPGGEVHRGNLQFLQNLVDLSTEDTDLLTIRSAGAYARTLEPLDEGQRNLMELAQYGIALVLLALVAVLPRNRRRHLTPISLPTGGAA
ncbi:MAG: Gldg family protein [Alphaproteobacteria bacterium]|nr:Gldg family protein [Alphaproteobacteria bacterium]